ncbi:MAG TPA: hypothetical protein PLB14_06250 [Smithellaceae bacterium]|jgi:hypothetical protein|nr:hypothetical protein [Syntrophaceae bacterium]HOE80419.1 hypothetical protein [Smithellaceae bacterium]HPL97596.1 hypothetical protein [Smithellaceae bacterium]HPV49291.1 hypothetical protein [Smithellaceae bacterium]HQF83923.1 hypothetical protein [Smithellaceae bacterium]
MQLKIETIKKRATVFFPEGSEMNGYFFVSAVSAFREGGELITELLAKDRNYIPFESDSGEIVLLRKENMMMVYIEEDSADSFFPGYKQVPVIIHMLDGRKLSGKVSFALPETHSRLSDFLNSREAFFRLEVEEKVYLIQNRFVKMITAM